MEAIYKKEEFLNKFSDVKLETEFEDLQEKVNLGYTYFIMLSPKDKILVGSLENSFRIICASIFLKEKFPIEANLKEIIDYQDKFHIQESRQYFENGKHKCLRKVQANLNCEDMKKWIEFYNPQVSNSDKIGRPKKRE